MPSCRAHSETVRELRPAGHESDEADLAAPAAGGISSISGWPAGADRSLVQIQSPRPTEARFGSELPAFRVSSTPFQRSQLAWQFLPRGISLDRTPGHPLRQELAVI